MKAWLLDELKGIRTLRMAEIADPVAGPGEVVLQLHLAALNPADRYLAENQYPAKPTLPHILGRDAIGTIVQTGNGGQDFKVGDRVVLLRSEVGVNRPGTFAEKVSVPTESLAAVPIGWSEEEAAGAALVYLTAHQALTQWGEIPPSVVLITGASGGVGVATVQLAATAGHTVVALSRSNEKREHLRHLGAAHCFDPADGEWIEQLKQALGKRRVDLAVDNIGGAGFSELLGVMGHNGRISVVGRLAGPVPEFNTASLFFRRLKIGGVAVGDYKPAQSRDAWAAIVNTLNNAGAKPRVDSVFAFDQIGPAFDRLEKGPMGKVILRIDSKAATQQPV